VAGRAVINVIMPEEASQLEETVVIAYGQQRKESVVAAISSIPATGLKQTPASNLGIALAGRLPGLTVLQRSGVPGGEQMNFYIRGMSTVNGQNPLTLVDGVKRIAQGNLDEKVDVRRTDELALLADSVNDMAGDLKKHIETLSKVTAEKERIATELSVATDIQEGMLPRNFGEIAQNKGFDLFATMAAAKEVGGDFYDFYMLDDRRLVITIADVSGKGVPAALFMVIAKTILKNSALSAGEEETFADVIRRANQQLCENNEEMLFVTVFFGVLDIRTGDFTYVNCGHNPPLLRQGTDGAFTYLRPAKKNLMMGVEEDLRFTQERLQMSPGSLLFCYTDGVTEAMNEAGEVYSEGQLQADLTGIPSGNDVPVADVLAALRKDITAHAGGAEQSDDITMLAIRYTG
jgi:sigma-B regulation protein RsbU (phosphoserine phosphatase)